MFGMGMPEVFLLVQIYSAICIGFIASKMGRNGIFFGVLSVLPIVSLVMLSILAFSGPRSSFQIK